jgi:hypothetical protein
MKEVAPWVKGAFGEACFQADGRAARATVVVAAVPGFFTAARPDTQKKVE